MHKRAGLLILVAALGGCLTSLTRATKAPPTGGGGGDDLALALTLTDPPTQAFPSSVAVQPPCNEQGFLVLDVAEGRAFTIEVETADGCAFVRVERANGSTHDLPPGTEVCAGEPATISSVGQAERTVVEVHETGACVGNTVSLRFQ